MPYNTYTMTLSGADNSAHTVNVETVEIWFEAADDDMGYNGGEDKKLGGVTNNTIDFRDGWQIRHVPYGYDAGGWGGNDNAKYLQLKKVLKKKFKRITAVSGPTKIGSDGTTPYWDEVLSPDGYIDVYISSLDEAHDDSNKREVTIGLRARRR